MVIISLPDQSSYALAYKVTLEGVKVVDSTYTRMNVFVDAVSGKVINTITLIAEVSVQGKAHTLYSGVQEITMDSYQGAYRLRDPQRDIITMCYDKASLSSDGIIRNLTEYVNATTTWEHGLCLDSISLTKAGDPNLFPTSGKWTPFVYIVDTGSSRVPIQGAIYDYANPRQAPMLFSNIGLNMIAPPYKALIGTHDITKDVRSGLAFFDLDSVAIVEGTHNWSDTIGNEGQYTIHKRANPALDAHWGMARTYDYFKEIFGRSSYDGRNGPITNLINAGYAFTGRQDNAAALNDGIMVFGLGDRYKMDAVVCLDVLGHEFTHMVTGANGHGGLVYQGESGALNESFSDIFGTCIEFYTKGSAANWTIGDEAFLVAPWMYRSLSDPKLKSHPDTYAGKFWVNPGNTSNDNGGVHINSGIQNKWFYLLCEGGSGTNDNNDVYQVSGIGMEKAQQIVYRNLTTYLTPYAKYIDAYQGSLQATEDLYGNTGREYAAVKAAWFAVGIGGAATSIENTNDASMSFKIYPNPAADQVNLFIQLDHSETVLISIKDIKGREVMRQDCGRLAIGTTNAQVAITPLNDGVYFVEVIAGTQKGIGKVTVQR